ncbi:MAG: hypothetical protein ABI678_01335 [Kofleriaceae bacterium]
MIKGGGVGDGAIDGVVNVYVIDNDSYAPIVDATVEVAGKQATTDDTGLVIFQDVSGAQTVAVKAAGYRGAVWQDVNGANLTIPVTKLGNLTAQQATLSGTVANWDAVTVPSGHAKAALVGYSQSDDLGDPANNIQTPAGGNVCIGNPSTCTFSVVTRTGHVTLTAAIVDLDPKGNADPSDDVLTIVGWATAPAIQVDAGVAQSGITLTQLEAGQLQNVTIDYGSPPDALAVHDALVGIELSKDEVVQLPVLPSGATKALVPTPAAFLPSATYRLTAIAQTTTADGPQSVILQRGQTATTLGADQWLTTPVDVTASRTTASLGKVANAKLHSVQWSDATGILLEITLFDPAKLTADVPALLALPTTGKLTAKAQGIGADIDISNFSLDTDIDLLWGISVQPETID